MTIQEGVLIGIVVVAAIVLSYRVVRSCVGSDG
jgi:hypothetical protein